MMEKRQNFSGQGDLKVRRVHLDSMVGVQTEQLKSSQIDRGIAVATQKKHRQKQPTQKKNGIFFMIQAIVGWIMQRLWMKRVPVLLQMSAVECGLASLAMVLSYYGRKTSVLELRTKYGVGRDGASARTIVKAARDFGMRVRAISLQKSDFSHIKLPAIVHWQFKHFLVVERWSQKHVDVVDPALGRRRLSAHEFDAGFTGIIILLEPGVNFSRESPPVSLSLKTYIWQSVRQAPGTVVQVIGSSILLQLFGLVTPILTKIVVDQILPFKLHDAMSILAAGMLMLIFAQGITTLLREWLLVYLRARIDTHLVLGFFEHLLSLPYSFFQQRSSGDLLMRMGSNTIIRDILSGQLVSTLLDSGMVVLYLLILLWQSPPFALLTLVIGLLQVLLVVGTYRPVRRLADEELAAQGQSQGYMAEALSGIATIKAAGAEYQAHERWSNLFFGQLNISIRRSYLSALLGMALTALRSFSSLALLWLGASEVLNGSITVGSMLALNTLAVAFLDPLTSLVGRVQQLLLAQAHLQRLADIMTAEPEQDVQKVHVPPRLTGHIRLENVSFQYTPDTPKVLHSLNVTIQAGQKVAIVGRTGSGKSTLGQLLLGLYLPTEGEIYYDHMPLHKLQYQEVRRQFGVVLQESTVFSGTILQNIMLNNPAMEKEQAIRAAQIAAFHEDVVRMPLGYETYVSEGGSALSGGQRQRLAIARAVAHHPAILLLDEATSALDVVTERRVAQNLESFPCTQIIIAHRLSTIRHADLILVLEQGTIVEQGTHDELLRHNGYYAHLIRQQMEKEKGDAQRIIKPKFTIG